MVDAPGKYFQYLSISLVNKIHCITKTILLINLLTVTLNLTYDLNYLSLVFQNGLHLQTKIKLWYFHLVWLT
jgi:hypothetical protein